MAKIFLSLVLGPLQHDVRAFPATRSAAIVAWPSASQRTPR